MPKSQIGIAAISHRNNLIKIAELTVGFLYGAGAETLIFVTGTSGRYPKILVPRQKNQSQLCIPEKARKIRVWVSGAEIQTSAVDTRLAIWVSAAEKVFKIVLGETRIFLKSLRGSQRQLCIKTRPLRAPNEIATQITFLICR